MLLADPLPVMEDMMGSNASSRPVTARFHARARMQLVEWKPTSLAGGVYCYARVYYYAQVLPAHRIDFLLYFPL